MINKIMKIEMAELGSAESVGPPYSLSDWVSECDCEWLSVSHSEVDDYKLWT